jgi:hypothetical protein
LSRNTPIDHSQRADEPVGGRIDELLNLKQSDLRRRVRFLAGCGRQHKRLQILYCGEQARRIHVELLHVLQYLVNQ